VGRNSDEDSSYLKGLSESISGQTGMYVRVYVVEILNGKTELSVHRVFRLKLLEELFED
jgi:hypothetical protein